MKPVATVQLPVGKFQIIVSDYTDNEELGKWVRRFARALALADPDLEPFAAELLKDVEDYRAADNRRKQEAKAKREQLQQQKSTTDASRGNSADDCKAPPSVGYLVADGETREGSQNFANTGNRAHLESGTSATTSFGSARPARGAAAKRPLRNRGPTSKLEFEEFIYEPSNNINTALAWEWYDIHSARDWTDSGGNPLNNWKGALINYCKSKQEDKK